MFIILHTIIITPNNITLNIHTSASEKFVLYVNYLQDVFNEGAYTRFKQYSTVVPFRCG